MFFDHVPLDILARALLLSAIALTWVVFVVRVIGLRTFSKMTDEEFKAASDFLRKVHQNVRAYWQDGATLAQLLSSGEVALAHRLYTSVRESMSSEALRVALSIAAIRAACSPAWVSRKA